MALMMLITQYSKEAYRSVADGKGGDRGKANEELMSRLEAKIIDQYFSPGDGFIYTILEGKPEIMTDLHFIGKATGSFQYIEVKLLISSEEFRARSRQVGEQVNKFDAPNRDEIDRMLLDE